MLVLALPLLGAAGALLYAGGAYIWVLKAAIDFLFGLSVSMMLLKSLFVPPYATVIAALAASFMFASISVLAVSAPAGSAGTVVVGGIISALMFWALTR